MHFKFYAFYLCGANTAEARCHRCLEEDDDGVGGGSSSSSSSNVYRKSDDENFITEQIPSTCLGDAIAQHIHTTTEHSNNSLAVCFLFHSRAVSAHAAT